MFSEVQTKDGGTQGANLRAISPVGALKLEAARHYLGGLSVPTMHRLIQRGLLQPNKSTRHLLFTISELDRFLRDGMS